MTLSAEVVADLAPGRRPDGFDLWCDAFLGWRPHSHQIGFGRSLARTLYLVCGIRFGKSDAAAARYLYHMFFTPGGRYINAALTQDQANIVVERAHQLALQGPLAGFLEPYVKSPFPTLVMKGNVRLQGRTVDDPNLLRGRAYDGVGVDEGAFAKEEAIKLLRGRTLDKHGWLAIYTTPKGMGTWLHAAYLKARWEVEQGNPAFYAETGTTYDNPHIPRAAIDDLRAEADDRWFDQEVLGKFVDMEGATFPASLLERIFLPGLVLEPKPLPGEIYVTAWDVARKVTRTAGITLACSKRPLRGVEKIIIKPGGEWRERYRAIDRAAGWWGSATMIDGTGPGDSVPENLTTRVEPFIFSRRSRQDLITELQSVCHTGDLVLPVEWNDVRTQMLLHTWAEDAEGQTWDELDALMMAVHYARRRTFRGPLLARLA